jgi:ElaB/YqjD/DUF883 family membrane-anchored ribosome-binding protein
MIQRIPASDWEEKAGESVGVSSRAESHQMSGAVSRAGKAVGGAVQQGAHAASDCIRANPWKALGASAVAGLILGILVGRR